MKTINVYVGGQIADFRIEQHKTQAHVANILGKSRASVANIEAGKQAVSIESLFILADWLDYEVSDFLPSREWYKTYKNKSIRKVVSYEIINQEESNETRS